MILSFVIFCVLFSQEGGSCSALTSSVVPVTEIPNMPNGASDCIVSIGDGVDAASYTADAFLDFTRHSLCISLKCSK